MLTRNQVNFLSTLANRAGSAKNLISYGQKLFNGTVNPLSAPGMTAQIMAGLGMKVPKGVIISADAAQAVIAGGQIVSDVSTAANIGSFLAPSALAINAISNIGEQMGLVDPNSPAMQAVTMGTDIALVIAGGGLNVLSDLKLVLDIANQISLSANSAAIVQAQSQAGLAQAVQNYERPEITAASKNFADYHNGKISIFQYMALIAQESPTFFDNFFPDIGVFLPHYTVEFSDTASMDTLFGGHRDYTSYATLKNVVYNPKTFGAALLTYYVERPMEGFRQYEALKTDKTKLQTYGYPIKNGVSVIPNHQNPISRISTDTLAIFSLLNPKFNFAPIDFDISPYLLSKSLTPYDLNGVGFTLDEATDFFPKVQASRQPITFNGVDYQDSNFQTMPIDAFEEKNIFDNIQNLLNYRYPGDVQKLFSQNIAKNLIREWSTLPDFPVTDIVTKQVISQTGKQSYRFIQNYWRSLSMFNYLANDPYFKNNADIENYDLYGKINYLESRFKQIQSLVTGRFLNGIAFEKVAAFFGTTADKITLRSSLNDTSAVFGLKNNAPIEIRQNTDILPSLAMR